MCQYGKKLTIKYSWQLEKMKNLRIYLIYSTRNTYSIDSHTKIQITMERTDWKDIGFPTHKALRARRHHVLNPIRESVDQHNTPEPGYWELPVDRYGVFTFGLRQDDKDTKVRTDANIWAKNAAPPSLFHALIVATLDILISCLLLCSGNHTSVVQPLSRKVLVVSQ